MLLLAEQCPQPSSVLLPSTQFVGAHAQVPVPAASLEGDVLLQTTEGSGHAFRAHSQVLSLASRVLKDLLSEQREELQAAAASEQPLVLPMPSFSGSQLHMLLQVPPPCLRLSWS